MTTKQPHLRYLAMRVVMGDADIIQRLSDIATVGHIRGPIKRSKPHHKDMWLWESSSAEAYAVAVAIQPMLGQRRQAQMRAAIVSWLSSRPLDQRTPIEHLLALVEKGEVHWLWQGHKQHDGYPTYTMPGTRSSVRRAPHRVLHEEATGIPLGRRRLKNGCGMVSCVRPGHWHLEAEDSA